MADFKLRYVRQLDGFAGEGHLYQAGTRFFLVFRGASQGGRWDACLTDAEGGWFSGRIATGDTRKACVENLRQRLQEDAKRHGG